MSLPAVKGTVNFMIEPKSISEAMDFAKMISNSDLCPSGMKGKPGNVIIAMQMGAEVGLSPMQALQNIAVINGRACLWGDAALAVVQSHPLYVSHREWIENEKDGSLIAYCSITRKGQEEYIKSFSQKDAERAGLWKKAGVWQQYPSRMLQMRARAFAIRDKFADALRGINMAEEVNDYNVVNIKNQNNTRKIENVVTIEQEPINHEVQFVELKEGIENCENEGDLRKIFDHIKRCDFRERPDLFKQLIDLKDRKKLELVKKVSDDFFGEEEVDQNTGEIKND